MCNFSHLGLVEKVIISDNNEDSFLQAPLIIDPRASFRQHLHYSFIREIKKMYKFI